jgi:hypothetical protein
MAATCPPLDARLKYILAFAQLTKHPFREVPHTDVISGHHKTRVQALHTTPQITIPGMRNDRLNHWLAVLPHPANATRNYM